MTQWNGQPSDALEEQRPPGWNGRPTTDVLLIPSGVWTLGADFTVPSWMTIVHDPLGVLEIADGVTLTIDSSVDGPMTQWLRLVGTGTVIFGLKVPELYPEWFGAIADGAIDCTVPLNIVTQLAAQQKKAVRLLAGTYKITDTWWITPHDSAALTAHVTGMGRGYATGLSQTEIDATDVAMRTKPAVVVQKARSVYVGHLLITGPNVAPSNLEVGDMLYNATWVTPGVRDSRYSPQCAVAIDVGIGDTPSDGGYPGITYLNTGGGSSDTVLDNLCIRDCVVGIICSPDAQPASQGDTVMIREPQIYGVKVGIALGQAQVRGCNVVGGNIGYVRDGINCGEYGQQQGAAVQVHGTQVGPGFQVIVAAPGISSTLITGIRAESMHRLGQAGIGSSTSAFPVTMINCDLHLGSPEINPAPVMWESASAGLLYIGGHIGSDENVKKPALLPFAYPMVFRGTQFYVRNRFRPYIGSPNDFNVPTTLEDCRIIDTGGSLLYGTSGRVLTPGARVSAHWSLKEINTAGGVYRYIPGSGSEYRLAVTASSFVFTSTQLTFNCTDPSYLLIGDLLLWPFLPVGASLVGQYGVGLEVTNKVGQAITCSLLYARSYYDDTFAPGYVQILVHEWAPGTALTGVLTSGNPVIASVSPTNILQDGDWLQGSTGIPGDARVVSGGGTASVTMNKNATANGAVTLFWGRLHTLNTTVAF